VTGIDYLSFGLPCGRVVISRPSFFVAVVAHVSSPKLCAPVDAAADGHEFIFCLKRIHMLHPASISPQWSWRQNFFFRCRAREPAIQTGVGAVSIAGTPERRLKRKMQISSPFGSLGTLLLQHSLWRSLRCNQRAEQALFDFDQLNQKMQRGIRRHRGTSTLSAVAEFWWDFEFNHATFSDELHAFCPASDDAVERK
jgi:hypothetical protein